jgi:hypothetical protein
MILWRSINESDAILRGRENFTGRLAPKGGYSFKIP